MTGVWDYDVIERIVREAVTVRFTPCCDQLRAAVGRKDIYYVGGQSAVFKGVGNVANCPFCGASLFDKSLITMTVLQQKGETQWPSY